MFFLWRYVVYGQEGCGKSISLAHLTNYGWQEGFILMSFAWVSSISPP
jgi:ABC-type transport system involved in cytochrome bd biosynthesis fused ATPase/permease subunit